MSFEGTTNLAGPSAYASKKCVTPTRKMNVPKAKCPENQHLVHLLAQKKFECQHLRPSSKFKFTLKAAIENLCKTKEVIGSYRQALTVKGIGSKIAFILFPTDDNGGDELKHSLAAANNHNRSCTAENDCHKRKAATLPNNDLSPHDVSPALMTTLSHKRKARKSPSLSPPSAVTAKLCAYERAKALAEQQSYKGQSLQWKVVFLIDDREKKQGRELLSERFCMANIPYEVRRLPIGDMAWVAQGRIRSDASAHDTDKDRVVVELLLGTVIERKTLDDLLASMHDKRFVEQQMRLKDSGLPQCLLLVEGELHRDGTTQRHNLEQCHTAIWKTSLHMGLQVIRTRDLTDTIQVLRRLHRQILFRSFRAAFCEESLPTFSEPSASGEHRRQQTHLQQHMEERGQRRCRQYQSLHELVFDTEPTPPEGMDRFLTYDELQAKIEFDKKVRLHTVKMLHASMVKQVPRIECKKAAAIVDAYPTPTHLFAAYEEIESTANKEKFLCNLATAEAGTTCRKTTVGLKSSKNLYVAYGMCEEVVLQPLVPCCPPNVKKPPPHDPHPNRMTFATATTIRGGTESEMPSSAKTSTIRSHEIICIDLSSSDDDDNAKQDE